MPRDEFLKERWHHTIILLLYIVVEKSLQFVGIREIAQPRVRYQAFVFLCQNKVVDYWKCFFREAGSFLMGLWRQSKRFSNKYSMETFWRPYQALGYTYNILSSHKPQTVPQFLLKVAFGSSVRSYKSSIFRGSSRQFSTVHNPPMLFTSVRKSQWWRSLVTKHWGKWTVRKWIKHLCKELVSMKLFLMCVLI